MPLTSDPRADHPDSGNLSPSPERRVYRLLPKPNIVRTNAAAMEALLRDIVLCDGSTDPFEVASSRPALKYINTFGTQVVMRMLRSAHRFQGFKIEFDHHMLKPHVLFLFGTLVNEFDLANTSPLTGIKALDVGCGALSDYASSSLEKTTDLLTQFYLDHPPVLAELLQLLGAQTFGVDSRSNDPDTYAYTPIYRHITLPFNEIQAWLQKLHQPMDLITCFNLFDRPHFSYHYSSPIELTRFFKGLRAGLSDQGLLFTSAPLLPSSPQNRAMNQRIFKNAGFRMVYEGYYIILEPRPSQTA